ncbi:MAG: amino acid adenylation domain-containing protein [Pseudomonadota bacterium]|nr:amino acid adenylation domain-containing protein [Pseudomonadota bacterium]
MNQQTETLPLTGVEYDPFAQGTLERVVPITEPQREIWLADQLGKEASLAYNESISLRLRGPLDEAALRASLAELPARHDSLRVTVGPNGNELCIAEELELETRLLDLSDRDAQRREAAVAERQRASVEKAFDVEAGPLLRAELLRLGDEEHVLILSAHHIVCDGWSFGVLLRDIAAGYARRTGDVARTLPAPESFADYATAEERWSRSRECLADEAYWLSQFERPAPALDLPLDRPRPRQRSFAAGREDCMLDAALVADLRALGARRGASLFTTLFTGFSTLLRRLSGQSEVVVGVAAAGQAAAGHEALVGHCVNILPVRAHAEPGTGFDEVLKTTSATVLDAFEHQRYTFGTLLRKLAMPRDPSRLPLVSVLFNLDQALGADALAFPGLRAQVRGNPRSFESFELFLNAVPVDGGIRLECQFNRDLFDARSVRRWMGLLDTLLRSAVAEPQTPWNRLDWVSAAELKALQALQPAPKEFDTSRLVHQRVAEQAAATPDSIAVAFGAVELSYLDLDRRSNAIAHALRERGIDRGSLVGVCLPRESDLLPALLGVLKSGAGFVPMDPGYPKSRLDFMAEDAGIGALLTTVALHGGNEHPRERTLLLDADMEEGAWARSEPLPDDDRSATPDSTAYVIHTSGSTGKPKGVVVPHRCLVNLLCSMQRRPGLSSQDRLLAVTTTSFDISMLELFLPLTVGARVVLAGAEAAREGDGLRLLLQESGATAMQATPSGWRLLIDAGWKGARGFKAMVGGESLPQDLADALARRCEEVWNMYGPTETTIWSTCGRIHESDQSVPIGTPIANTSVWVLDEHLEPCPTGVPGELWIGGDGVTDGYLNHPELTAERFLPDPRASAPRARMYRTGDRGRWRNDGMLDHLGRLDLQVKVRGYRIEPGEIENQLASHADVARCAVLAREDRPGDVRLVAYVVVGGNAADETVLLDHLRAALPAYMVPQHVVFLPEIPLTPNGKVDRKQLPAPDAGARRAACVVPPRTDMERSVAAIMEQVLALPELSVDDDFFALGGHSLLAAQLTARINREMGVKLSMRAVFDAPTVAALAALLESGAATEIAPAAPVTRLPNQRRAPMSLAQDRLHMLEQFNPGQLSYHVPSTQKLIGPLDVDAFNRAFDALMQRQNVLRTIIGHEGATPVQIVHDRVDSGLLPVEDLSTVPEGERDQALAARFKVLTEEPFDLAVAPLFRAKLFKLEHDVHAFYFMAHHIIWDGWSFDLLYTDLAELYAAQLESREPRLPELTVSYGDFAAWHNEWVQGPDYMRQLAVWRERLELDNRSGGPQPLPTDKPRRPGMAGRGASHGIAVDKDLTEALHTAGLRMDATIFVVLLTAYFVLLNQSTGHRELIVGTPVRGRDREEFEGIMGYFTNLLPLYLRLDPSRPFADAVRQVKAVVLDSFANPDVRLEHLARDLSLRNTAGGAVLYQSLFSFQDIRQRVVQWGNVRHERMAYFQPGATEDLGLWFAEDDSGLLGGMLYNTEIFHQQTADTLCDRYMALLRSIAADPWQLVEALTQVDDGRPRLIGNTHAPAAAAGATSRIATPAPRSAAEDPRVRYLLDLWTEVLGVPVTPGDNFFELGGNSMVGVEMAARVARDSGVRLNLVQLASQTLEQVAEALPKNVSPGRAVEGLSSRMLGKVRRLFG